MIHKATIDAGSSNPSEIYFIDIEHPEQTQYITLNWYFARESGAATQYSEIYERNIHIGSWNKIDTKYGSGHLSYLVPLDDEINEMGLLQFKIVKTTVFPGGWEYPATVYNRGTDVSNPVTVSLPPSIPLTAGPPTINYVDLANPDQVQEISLAWDLPQIDTDVGHYSEIYEINLDTNSLRYIDTISGTGFQQKSIPLIDEEAQIGTLQYKIENYAVYPGFENYPATKT